MIEQHTYDGHDIAIELLEVAPMEIRWVWKIDGVHCSKSRHTLHSEEVARAEALLYARIMVGRLRSRKPSMAN